MTYVFSQEQHGHLIPYIAALHASCMQVDRMVGPFRLPLNNDKLLPWWKERIAESNRGARVIVLWLPETAPGTKPVGTDLRGLAMLDLCRVETGTFRATIDVLLVNQRHRRQGGARALVRALEYEAAKRGRTMLRADTDSDTVAESAFRSFGYVEAGRIPNYSQGLQDGKKGLAIFYKDLLTSS